MQILTAGTYKYRCYPTKSQISVIENHFSMCRHLYNWNLSERIDAYENLGVSIKYSDQQNALPALKKERPWFTNVYSQVLQNVLFRLDNAYHSIFKFLGNLFKFKAEKNFDHRHTACISRIKIFFQRRSWTN